MGEYTVVEIDTVPGAFGGSFKKARAALGVRAFGLQVIDMPPNAEGYPEHDHAADGQEEVYATLRGGGEMDIEGERVPLSPDHLVAVRAGTRRKVLPGPEGIRLLVVGGVPGAAYEPPAFTELDAEG